MFKIRLDIYVGIHKTFSLPTTVLYKEYLNAKLKKKYATKT